MLVVEPREDELIALIIIIIPEVFLFEHWVMLSGFAWFFKYRCS